MPGPVRKVRDGVGVAGPSTPTEPAMITDPGNVCAGVSANGSGSVPLVGSVPSLPAEMTSTMPALTARCIAASSRLPGVDAAERHVDDLGARVARGVDARGDRAVEKFASAVRALAQEPGESARSLTIVASNATPIVSATVARRGGDRADRRAVAALVADAATAGDVAARRVDAAGELVEARIDAAVDDTDLDALAGRARIVGGDRIGSDRIIARPDIPPCCSWSMTASGWESASASASASGSASASESEWASAGAAGIGSGRAAAPPAGAHSESHDEQACARSKQPVSHCPSPLKPLKTHGFPMVLMVYESFQFA